MQWKVFPSIFKFASIFLLADASLSQTIFVPTSQELSPSFTSGASKYSPDTGVDCPTPTMNVTAFGRSTNGWSDSYYSLEGASGGVGNYGGAIGFSYPFGGNLREFCNKFAESKAKFEKLRVQADLLNKCRYLAFDLGVTGELFDENKEMFEKNGPLSSFAECRAFRSLLNPRKTKPTLSLDESSATKTEPFSPKPPATYNINQP
ncbi:hypothetical protein FB106_11473 [Synechococcus sp. Ace-Pa]|nr:hypothetical protein FB106_11473 [Synechococcus sp. Ace-Pa]